MFNVGIILHGLKSHRLLSAKITKFIQLHPFSKKIKRKNLKLFY